MTKKTERIEADQIDAVIEAERACTNFEPKTVVTKMVLENTTLYNQQFIHGLHYDSEGRYIEGDW